MIATQYELGTMCQPREEINRLKRDWYSDPCWDIEDTEGFEVHYIELKAFRLGCELKWRRIHNPVVENKAKKLNCSSELAAYILDLEDTINHLLCCEE